MDWTTVLDMVDRLDKRGENPGLSDVILAAERWVRSWAAQGCVPPHYVCAHDGSIHFDWRLPGEVIHRVEVDKDGRAESMTTFPAGTGRDAVFQDLEVSK